MPLRIQRRELLGFSVLSLEGTLPSHESQLFREVQKLISEGHRDILLDLVKVTAIDSAGIGELLMTEVSANRQGASLKLAGLESVLERMPALEAPLKVFEKVPIHTLSYWATCPKCFEKYYNGYKHECRGASASVASEDALA